MQDAPEETTPKEVITQQVDEQASRNSDRIASRGWN